MANWTGLEVSGVFFVATLIRSTFGFGEALVAVPLLALVMPVQIAAPVAALVSITVALIVVAQDWRQVHARSAGWLVLSTFFGIPVGLLALTTLPEAAVKTALALVILAFSIYFLLQRAQPELKNDRLAWVFGFTAGVLGGAYGMNGPPLAVYASLRRWSPVHFRATLQGYFLPASILGMLGYWVAGLCTPAVGHLYLFSLPVVVTAIFLGRAINRRMHGPRFLLYVHMGLVLIGAVLLLQAVRAH